MTLPRNRIMLALAIVVLAQTAVLASMVVDRVSLLRSGQEITLPIQPVDPRDLFRGEYVRLGYAIGNVPLRLLEGPSPSRNSAFYVLIEKKDGGVWQPVRISRAMPTDTSPDRIALKGRASHGWPETASATATVWIRYGIESYFVQQGRGPKIEGLARESKLAARIAIDKGGNAAIKGILVDGKPQYEEPLF